jgi:hypothetical protein
MSEEKIEEKIRRLAYELWEREGSPEGRAEDFWEQAKLRLGVESAGAAEREEDVTDESRHPSSENELASTQDKNPVPPNSTTK